MKPSIHKFLLGLAMFGLLHRACAQGTLFTYQGRLDDNGTPANGTNYELNFFLYNVATNGMALTNLDLPGVSVSNGLFTVALDFGPAFDGTPRWLEISVQKNGGGFTPLAPRQQITPSPYAITAGTVAGGGISPGTYGNAVVFNNPSNQFTGAYSGNGAGLTNVPGALSQQIVSGLSVQTIPNTGYILTNDSPVTLTLPASPKMGDVIRITCTGFGGWTLAQNPGQFVVANNLIGTLGNWTLSFTTNPVIHWLQMVSSPDGAHLLAVGPGVLISQNGGATWNGPLGFPGFACESADGTQIELASPGGGGIYNSTNFGMNFNLAFQITTNWTGIAGATDFSHLVAVAGGGSIYATTNPLTNWMLITNISGADLSALASSFDGSRLVTTANGGGIYASTNFGTSWAITKAPTNLLWNAIASSSDGRHLVACAGASGIYTSADFGASWAITMLPSLSWVSVASSADGTHLIAGGQGPVYISTDSGATWTEATLSTAGDWQGVASSASGNFIAGDHASGGIYLYKTSSTAGPAGSLSGGGNTAVDLEYTGNGEFFPVSHEGTLSVQ